MVFAAIGVGFFKCDICGVRENFHTEVGGPWPGLPIFIVAHEVFKQKHKPCGGLKSNSSA